MGSDTTAWRNENTQARTSDVAHAPGYPDDHAHLVAKRGKVGWTVQSLSVQSKVHGLRFCRRGDGKPDKARASDVVRHERAKKTFICLSQAFWLPAKKGAGDDDGDQMDIKMEA